MSEKKHVKWLTEQLARWVDADLIHQSQAVAIKDFYPADTRNIGRMVLSGIGAAVFGLGVILFFAYNWDEMHRFVKLLIVFSAILAAHGGAQFFARQGRDNWAASEGLALLGTILFGAGIWLVSQIYHIDEHYPNAFLAWGMGTLLMAWARASLLQGLLSLILFAIWGWLEFFKFNLPNAYAPWLILFGLAPLAWTRRSGSLLFCTLFVSVFFWVANLVDPLEETVIYMILGLSAVLIAVGGLLGRLPRIDFPSIRAVLSVPGFAAYLVIIFALTFVDFSDDARRIAPLTARMDHYVYWLSIISSGAAFLLALCPFKNVTRMEPADSFHLLLIAIGLLIINLVGPGWWAFPGNQLAIVMNLIFIGHCLLFITHGSHMQQGWEVAAGCLLFVCLVFARYFDLFDSLLARSLVFLVLGGCLFGVSNFYFRRKKCPSADPSLGPSSPGEAVRP